MTDVESINQLPGWLLNSGPDRDVVLSTRIRLARNLINHKFTSKASLLERKSIFDEITAVVKGLSRFKDFECLNFNKLKKLDQQFLNEKRAVSADLISVDGDRGVVCDHSYRVSVMINEEDHVRVQCMDSGNMAEEIWNVLNLIDDALGEELPFAFDKQRGFLTSCPTNAGTGMRASFLMHLPGLVLTKTIDQVLQGASHMGVSTRGFFGEHSNVVGNFFQLSNQAAIGATEEEFLKNTRSIINNVLNCERSARESVLKDAKTEITDKVFRAYGILMYARTLAIDEFLNLMSALRLGCECDLIDRVNIEAINRTILLSLPAHLQLLHERIMEEDEINQARAEMVRKTLSEI